jgi:light-harvesting complex 1 alpha chain
MHRPPIEFRTVVILYTLLGIIMALVIHFVVLSSPRYNWLNMVNGLMSQSQQGLLALVGG